MHFSRTLLRTILLGITGAALLWPPSIFTARAAGNASPQQQGPIPAQNPGPQTAAPPAQSQQPKVSAPTQQPGYTINVTSNVVRVDVVVTNQEGDIITGLTKDNFRVTQDNTPQQVTNFTPSDAPITIVLLMEYSRLYFTVASQNGEQWAELFLTELKPQDWAALMTYDMRTHVVTDFTHDRDEVLEGLRGLMIPSFRESNMFDGLIETLDRLQDVQGKKSILLIASGTDSFSKNTLDKAYKRVKQTDVTIFCVGTAEVIENAMEMNPGMKSMIDPSATYVDYQQAKNELRTFSQMTGGYAWFPRFYGEMPDVFHNLAEFLRNQYSLAFTPSGDINDGKYHKIKVDVVDKDGQPMMVADKKGKMKKVIVYAREGYLAPSNAVGD